MWVKQQPLSLPWHSKSPFFSGCGWQWIWRFIVCRPVTRYCNPFRCLSLCDDTKMSFLSWRRICFTGRLLFRGLIPQRSHYLPLSPKIRKAQTMRRISQQFGVCLFTTQVFGDPEAILRHVVAQHCQLNANVSLGCQAVCWPPWCGLCLSRSNA